VARELQLAIRRFGFVDGTWPICPTVPRVNDVLTFVRHEEERGPEPSMQPVIQEEIEDSELPPMDIDDILDEEGGENEIFTYRYQFVQ
jgi:hypothetical protein